MAKLASHNEWRARERSRRTFFNRSLLPWAVVAAPAIIVVSLGELHAHLIGHYSFTGTARFGWVIGYVLLLELAAYLASIPDLWTATAREPLYPRSAPRLAVLPAYLSFSSSEARSYSLVLWCWVQRWCCSRRSSYSPSSPAAPIEGALVTTWCWPLSTPTTRRPSR